MNLDEVVSRLTTFELTEKLTRGEFESLAVLVAFED